MVTLALPDRAAPVAARPLDAWLLLPLLTRRRSRVRLVRDRRRRAPTARRSTRRSPGTGLLELLFCVLLSAGLMLSLSWASRTRAVEHASTLRAARAAARPPTARCASARLLLLRARGRRRRRGWGEAAPLEPYDGVSARALPRGARALRRGRCATPRRDRTARELLDACRAADACRRRSRRSTSRSGTSPAGARAAPVVRAARPTSRWRAVPVNATIGAERPRRRRRAGGRRACAPGFRCVKVKVGIGDDAGRVAAVRAAVGPDVALRLDANGAWDVDEARARDRARWRPPASSSSRSRSTASRRCARCASATRVRIAMDETATSRARSRPARPTRSA